MAEENARPFERGQLKREATDWFIRMRDEDADKLKPEFEAWLARGALHRAAYNRVANLHGAGKNVNWDNLPAPRPVRGAVKLTLLGAAGLAFLLAFMIWKLLFGPVFMPAPNSPLSPGKPQTVFPSQIATKLGEIRSVTLPDGSRLILDTDSLVTADFRPDERELRLERGRARFEVAHERRPFVVDAGSGEVIAHGTMFDVSLDDGSVNVALLRGKVDVTMPSPRRISTFKALAHLRPGEGIRFANSEMAVRAPEPAPLLISDWPSGLMEFDDASLAEIINAANRYSVTKIRILDPRLARTAVSGTFRVNDSDRLATQLADLLDLSLTREPGGLLLRQKPKIN